MYIMLVTMGGECCAGRLFLHVPPCSVLQFILQRKHRGQIKENVKGEAWRTEWMLTVLVTVEEYLRNAFSLC